MIPTVSELPRVEACPASADHDIELAPTEHSERGTHGHRFLELAPFIGREAALKDVPEEYREDCADIPIEELPAGAHEIPMAYHVETDTCRVLKHKQSRTATYAGLRQEYVCGTVDLFDNSCDGPTVWDYKFGHETVRAKNHLPLHAYGLFASKVYKLKEVRVGIIRLHDTAEPTFDTHMMDESELSYTRERIKRIARDSADHKFRFVEGDHCRYCPRIYSCPVKVSLVASLVDMPSAKAVTAQTVSAAYRRTKEIERALKLVKSRIDELAKSRPVHVDDGVYYGMVECKGNERLDGKWVHHVISDLYGKSVADKATSNKITATKKSIREALTELKATQPNVVASVAAAFDEVLTELRRVDAISSSRSTRLKEREAYTCATDGCVEMAMSKGGVCDYCDELNRSKI